eukprot:gb/GFBE01056403.1/.p1 GENE.gb/GFBE01056403.1/~~gb/GFBE01056403.1/.p1  ORF type:complete len:554 (+),score=146.17 gb/GFBE01056403.1/:1-1662(+)
MGNSRSVSRNGGFSDIGGKIEALSGKLGKIPVSGRYHKLPKRIEDDYEVCEKVLGSGYNGVVRMATQKGSSTQKFAVKAFKIGNVASEKRVQLQTEVGIFLCMDHPHITRLYDVYESEEYLYLVMECMEGGELFDRVTELKRFTERDAADAVSQMLLALNYIHSHGIVHRDLKLENFLYDYRTSNHLKLIDFGFSKMWDPNIKMCVSCGTLAYVAPEVLQKAYTSQCDLWSLGVIAFVLLSGYMPFSGAEAVQTKNISAGYYVMKPERWNSISKEGKEFIKGLLEVDPEKRLTAATALEHRWVANRHEIEHLPEVDDSVVDALRQFGQASKFRRCCLEMMAWSLSNEERSKVRQYFISMDETKQGTITLAELKKVLMDKFHISNEETLSIFNAMDTNHDEEIHYSDFLAAMVSTRIALHDDLLKSAFKRFDTDSSGYITPENLREVLGETFEGEHVEQLMAEADMLKDGRISYEEFVAYLRGDPLQTHQDVTAQIIDTQLKTKERHTFLKGVPKMSPKISGRSNGSKDRIAGSAPNGRPGSGSAAKQECCVVS